MARGSVVDGSRMTTAKILATPHLGYLDYEQLQKKLTDFPLVVRRASSAETVQKTPRRNLVDDDASLCGEQRGDSAFSRATTVLSGETPSCRLHLAAQLAGVRRDGQGFPGVRLRGLTWFFARSLVLSEAHVCPGFFFATSWMLERTH